MKKKTAYGIAGAVVFAAVAALIFFVMSGKDTVKTDLTGVWKVASNVTEGTVEIPENEYMVIDAETLSDYRDGSGTAYASSVYKIKGDVLDLTDLSRWYHLAQYTDTYVSLYTDSNTFMSIVKAESEDVLKEAFDASVVTGKWNIVFRASDQPIENEYLVFRDGKVSVYRNNGADPVIEADYVWDGDVLKVEALQMEMTGANTGKNKIILTDRSNGYVWQLEKAAN